jgi:hypothetical protein
MPHDSRTQADGGLGAVAWVWPFRGSGGYPPVWTLSRIRVDRKER